jgi:hypothetical protein
MSLLPAWATQDWFPQGSGVHNAFVTITYSDGTAVKAIVPSHEPDEIRAIAAGSDDVQIFRRHKGTWFSENIDPVGLEFEWQHVGVPHVPSDGDCVCSKALAAHLIQTLYAGGEGDEAESDTLHVLSPQEARVAIHRSELALG